MELRGNEERVVGKLDEYDEALIPVRSRFVAGLVLEAAAEHVVDLEAMPVALVDDALAAEYLPGPGALVELDRVGASARIVPPRSVTSFCSRKQVDHRVRRLGIELGRVRALHPADVAGVIDDGHLHPQADAERDTVLAREPRSGDLALDPALAEAAGIQDPVRPRERIDVSSSLLTESTSTLTP